MIDREDDADDIKCLTADLGVALGVALVKVQGLRETVKSMLADGNSAQTVCAGSKGQVKEFVSIADYYRK